MENSNNYYDVAVVGGGLAGLSAAILMAQAGFSVVLFEKEKYPFHKVCGEYISLESRELLIRLGVSLDDFPVIDELTVSSPNAASFTHKLPLGGFGVSRYNIDNQLADICVRTGVKVYDGTRVNDIGFSDNVFLIGMDNITVTARLCCGSFGKRSNIDIKWGRAFIKNKPNALNNYIGVKYHAILDHPRNNIALHNFSDGYCGFAPIEDGKTCVCYLTTAHNLKLSGNDIKQMEKNILFKNPHIKAAFEKAEWMYGQPLTISQISFDKKNRVQDHVLLIGDAAGMIAPLCGNGMSMALHGSRIASEIMIKFMRREIERKEMEEEYERQWKRAFSRRLTAGRLIQRAFGNDHLTNGMVALLKKSPSLISMIIRQTHGK
ncbi:MAG: NAD(P)/FAD-dependent oxidoreductase [Chitinophagaceae bacterium]|nr:NAD(P)/FAD-dependent oxidoreductase [Chitinophagaceae bacterium]